MTPFPTDDYAFQFDPPRLDDPAAKERPLVRMVESLEQSGIQAPPAYAETTKADWDRGFKPIKGGGKIRMGTTAHHLLGDISREQAEICVLTEESETHYMGFWLEGFAMMGTKFPKDSVRELTEEEKTFYHDRPLHQKGKPWKKLNVRDVTSRLLR